MDEMTTWAEVREAMHDARVEKRVLAASMGYRADEFSRMTNNRDSLPTTEWVERFKIALEAQRVRTQ